MGWGNFLDRVTRWLPIQGRVERIKNKIDKLERQKRELLQGQASPDKARKLVSVERELAELERMLKNLSKD